MSDDQVPDKQINDAQAARDFEDHTASAVQRLIDIHGDEAAIFAAMLADEARDADIDDPAYDFWMQVKRIIDAYQRLEHDTAH